MRKVAIGAGAAFEFVGCVLAGLAIGRFFDRVLNNPGVFTAVFLLVGMSVGAYLLIRILRLL